MPSRPTALPLLLLSYQCHTQILECVRQRFSFRGEVLPFPPAPTICLHGIGGSFVSLCLHLISPCGIVASDRKVSKGVERQASGLVLSLSISSGWSPFIRVCESGRHLNAIMHFISHVLNYGEARTKSEGRPLWKTPPDRAPFQIINSRIDILV